MLGDSGESSTRHLRDKSHRLDEAVRREERLDALGRTARALSALPGDEWTVFDDIRWPGRRFAGIDHVVVGPPGVFVIQVKDWTGRITSPDGRIRLDGKRRDTEVIAATEAAFAVAQLLPEIPPTQVQPVLCFVGGVQIAGWSSSALLCDAAHVADKLASRPPVLDEAVRESVVRRLDAQLAEVHHPPKVVEARRSSVLRTLVAPLVGGIAALGLVAVLLTHPNVLHEIGDAVVSIVDPDDAPPRVPPDRHDRDHRDGPQ